MQFLGTLLIGFVLIACREDCVLPPETIAADQTLKLEEKSDPDEVVVAEGKILKGAAVHQSFIEVNEKGTEAAAATGIIDDNRSPPAEVPFYPVFNADRPFVYFIRDLESGALLFMGRFTNPGV